MLAKIDVRIAGIPCLIGVTAWPNDDDGVGEWTILDRNGRPAPWLERKVDARDEYRIFVEMERYLAADRQDAMESHLADKRHDAEDARAERWYARNGY